MSVAEIAQPVRAGLSAAMWGLVVGVAQAAIRRVGKRDVSPAQTEDLAAAKASAPLGATAMTFRLRGSAGRAGTRRSRG